MKYVMVFGNKKLIGRRNSYSAEIGLCLNELGLETTYMMIDPILNYSTGNISPEKKGEIFVLGDGTETDLAVGIYERMCGVNLTKASYVTAGQILSNMIEKTRKGYYNCGVIDFSSELNKQVKNIFRVFENIKIEKTRGVKEIDVVIVDVQGIMENKSLQFLAEGIIKFVKEEEEVYILSSDREEIGNEGYKSGELLKLINLLKIEKVRKNVFSYLECNNNMKVLRKISIEEGKAIEIIKEAKEFKDIISKENLADILMNDIKSIENENENENLCLNKCLNESIENLCLNKCLNKSNENLCLNESIENESLNECLNKCLNESNENECLNKSIENECLNKSIENECLNKSIENECLNKSIENECLNKSIENECLNESNENLCLNKSIENECLNKSNENLCLNESIENECLNKSIENECLNESNENLCLNESNENECLKNIDISFKPYNNHIDISFKHHDKCRELKIFLISEFLVSANAYCAIEDSLMFANKKYNIKIKMIYFDIHRSEYTNYDIMAKELNSADGIILPGGFSSDAINTRINVVKYARENNIPFIGICQGFQIALIEFAINVLNIPNATSEEFNCMAKDNIISRVKSICCKNTGEDIFLGEYSVTLSDGDGMNLYSARHIRERFRHRYAFNKLYRDKFEANGLVFLGKSSHNCHVLFKLSQHKFFTGVQYHPELRSKINDIDPIIKKFIDAVNNGKW